MSRNDGETSAFSKAKFWLFIIFIVVIPILISICPIFKLNLDKPIKAGFIQLPDFIPFEGNLRKNNFLEKARYLAHKKLVGPETIVFKNGTLYTGLVNGQIVTVETNGNVRKIVQIGEQTDEKICNDYGPNIHSHAECGRPLGLRFKPNTQLLYVADAYLGIFKVDVLKKTKELVFSSNDNRLSKAPLKLVNDLDFDGDVIYFIDSSNERNVNEAIEEHIEATPKGRLFSFDENTNSLELLLDNLYFPNGLQLMPDKLSILINENSMSRILRYYLKGPNKGKKEVFADIPGFGDTIRLTEHETLLVPFALARHSKYSSVNDLFGKYPLIRTILGAVLDLRLLLLSMPKYGLLAEYDLNGRLLRSWHDSTGKVIQSNTNAAIFNDKIYIGSFYNDFIAVIDYL